MTKIQRDQVVSAALELLDEQGLDALSTRRLAQKLGVESATLYWHFRDKSTLLAEMAAAVLAGYQRLDVPADTSQWSAWFADNARSFRRALLAHRDGARLHAGTPPYRDELARRRPKIAYLVGAGFTRREAGMALFAARQFTIGCVLDEQAPRDEGSGARPAPGGRVDPEAAFEFGLALMVDSLRHRTAARGRR
jgi:TetR/AcrR family tetracycline transcriptional repressor